MVNLYEVFNKKVEFMFSISPYTKDIINEGFPLVLIVKQEIVYG